MFSIKQMAMDDFQKLSAKITVPIYDLLVAQIQQRLPVGRCLKIANTQCYVLKCIPPKYVC